MTTKTYSFKKLRSVCAFLLLLVAVLMPRLALAEDFITDVLLIGGNKAETENLKNTYQSQGWTLINQDLNEGASGDYIFLLYKKASVFEAESFITKFYIKSGSGAPDSFTDDYGVAYTLTPYNGGSHFKAVKGDLNSNTGENTASIHLYYTRTYVNTFSAINNIYFVNTKSGASGAVGENGDNSTGYDLNKGAGGKYIYMHIDKSEILPLSGSGTFDSPFLINNTDDWNIFARRVAMAIEPNKYYKLMNDIEVTMPAGAPDKYFYGWFYGNNKTLTVNINGSETGLAPFMSMKSATIRDLTVQGNVTSSGLHASGLVGVCAGNANYITDCKVLTNVNGSQYVGGVVGYGTTSHLVMQSTYYGGGISGFSKYAGGLIGWSDDMDLTLRNCLFKGGFATTYGTARFHPIACKNAGSTVETYVSRTFYSDYFVPTDLGNISVPGAAGAPVSSSSVEGSDYEVVLADGQTYYAPSYFSQKVYYGTSFEDGMDGWTIVNGYTVNDPYGGGPSTGRIWTTDSNTGTDSFIFFPYLYSHKDQYLISPEMNTTSNVRFSFFVKGDVDQNVSFQIGYSKTTSDISSFTWTEVYTYLLPDWIYVMVNLPAGVKYVAIKDLYVNDRSDMLIDDISVEELYPMPINFSYSDLTDRSITFTWDKPDPEVLNYTWKYRKTSNNNWISTTTSTDTSVTLTGLEASTEYEFYLQANYANGNSSNSAIATFTTSVPMVFLPHIQDFEDGMQEWEMMNCVSGTGISREANYTGDSGFLFEKGGDDEYQYLQSPLFEGKSDMKMVFYAKNPEGEASFVLAFADGSGTEDGTVLVGPYTVKRGDWTEYVVNDIPKQYRYVFIVWVSGEKLYVDDICFYENVSVDFAKEGYATYYDSQHDLILPYKMKARIMTGVDSSGNPIYQTIADPYVDTPNSWRAEDDVDFRVVPAGIPVILQVAEADEPQTLQIALDNPRVTPYNWTNLLKGSDTETTTFGGDFYYKLKYNQYGTDLGWYWDANSGTAFTSAAHEAWLALPASMARDRRYMPLATFDDPTGIEAIDSERVIIDEKIFNLSGQQLQKLQKGINIINGRKVLIK